MPDIVCENLPMPVRDVIEDRAPVEVSFNLSKDYADKILSASGYVVGCRSKIEGGYVLFGGKAVFNLVFMGDGAERLETALRFDFKKALPSENYKWGETVYRLEDLSWSPSDGGVTLSATLNYRVDLFGEETVPFVKDFVGLKKQEEFSYDCRKKMGGLFDFEEEVMLPKIKKVLASSCDVTVTHQRAVRGMVVAEGDLVISIAFSPDAGGEEVMTESKKIPFRFEIDCPEAADGDGATVYSALDDLSVTVFSADEDRKTKLSVKGAVMFTGFVVKTVTSPFVADCYSPQNRLEITKNTYTYNGFGGQRSEEFKIYGKAVCDVPEYSRLIKVISPGVAVTSSSVDDGALKVEGMVFGDGIFVGDDGPVGRRIELPFSQSVDTDKKFALVTAVTVSDLEARLKSGRVEVDCHVTLTYEEWEDREQRLLSDVTVGEEISKKPSAITVYMAKKGDEEWDVVKATGADKETILAFNPQLDFPLVKDERIIILRKNK